MRSRAGVFAAVIAGQDLGEAGGAGGIFDGEGDGRAEIALLCFGVLCFRRLGDGVFGCAFVGGGFFGGSGRVGFVELLEKAEFALEGAFGGGFVAESEIVVLDLLGPPVDGCTTSGIGHEDVEIDLGAAAVPFSLSRSDDEIVVERVFGGFIEVAPVGEKGFPLFLRFVREDESAGAGAVFGGILRRGRAAFGRSGAGAATIAFFGFGIFGVVHLLSALSVTGRRARFRKI